METNAINRYFDDHYSSSVANNLHYFCDYFT